MLEKPSGNSDRSRARRQRAVDRIDEQIQERGEEFARLLGFDRAFTHIGLPAPSALAIEVSRLFVTHAEERIHSFLRHNPGACAPPTRRGKALLYCLPEPSPWTEPAAVDILPLAQRCCPDLIQRLPGQWSGLKAGVLRSDWDSLAAQVRAAIHVEHDLWARCAQMDRIPYPFAFRAIQDVYRPDANGHVACLCLRCGLPLRGKQRRKVLPLSCADCSKRVHLTDHWPPHALMPHTRGTWWLECQVEECFELFVGREQRLRCDAHRLERNTPRNRVALQRAGAHS